MRGHWQSCVCSGPQAEIVGDGIQIRTYLCRVVAAINWHHSGGFRAGVRGTGRELAQS